MYLAVGVFNEGNLFILSIMNMLDIIIGRQSKSYANDKRQVARQERRSLSGTKETRKAHRKQLLTENEFYEEIEGPLILGSQINQ